MKIETILSDLMKIMSVSGFENEMCEYTGAKQAAALSAGTAAIHLGLKAAGVREGDRVFCQSLTFSATANPIIYLGAEPVFIDSDEKTWNMSPAALRRAFEKYFVLSTRPSEYIFAYIHPRIALYTQCPFLWNLARIPSSTRLTRIRFAVAADTPHNSRTSEFMI